MTVAEEKVSEISDKLVNKIDDLRDKGYDDAFILGNSRLRCNPSNEWLTYDGHFSFIFNEPLPNH